MKLIKFLFLLLATIVLSSCDGPKIEENTETKTSSEDRELYQLKTYTFDSEEQVKVTDTYLKEAFIPRLKALNINNIGVFKSKINEEDSTLRTFVLIPFSSLNHFSEIESQLNDDPEYKLAGRKYLDAPFDNPPYNRIESTLLKAFSDMPKMEASTVEGPRFDRIYELRSYESATENYYMNKVDMFNDGGEIKLFDRLDFNAVFYGEVISGSKMPNLMYMTTFSNQKSRDEHWDAFFKSQEWTELKAMEKYMNNVSHIDIYFLYPTDYSDY